MEPFLQILLRIWINYSYWLPGGRGIERFRILGLGKKSVRDDCHQPGTVLSHDGSRRYLRQHSGSETDSRADHRRYRNGFRQPGCPVGLPPRSSR